MSRLFCFSNTLKDLPPRRITSKIPLSFKIFMTLPSTHIKKFNFCYAFHSWSPGILKENSTFLWNRTGKKVYCNSAVYARSYNIIRFFSCQNQVPSYIIYYQTTYIIYYQYIIYTTKKNHLNGTNQDILELRRQLASFWFQKWSPILGYTLLGTT